MSGAATGPPSVCSKPPYENECAHLLLRPNLDQRQPQAEDREGGTEGGKRSWFGADWELCMKWNFVQYDGQISECMGMLIVTISREICQIISSPKLSC